MKRKERATEYFREGYNCAQSVVMACAGSDADIAKAAAAFGGGIGRMQGICGAVTGAYISIGLAYASDGIPTNEDKIKVYDRVRAFRDLFISRNRTDICHELLGEDLNTPEGRERIKARNLHETVCEKCINDAIDILDEISRR